MTSCPSSAGRELPETGASTKVTRCRVARSASRSDHSTPTVLIWTQTASGPSVDRAPSGPVITCSTAAPSVSMVISTSTSAAAAAGEVATSAPSAASSSVLAGVRFQTRTRIPARSRLRAIGAPMVPVPSTATARPATVWSGCSSHTLRGRAGGRDGGGHDGVDRRRGRLRSA